MSQNLAGRTVLITGANTGIGRATAVALARRGARLVLAGRSEERTRAALDEVRAAGAEAGFLPLDLGDLASVRRAASTFLDGGSPLHVLINNAGLAGSRGTTADGFELTFGTNHLGPYLFTRLLLPRLREAGGARIVNVASVAHFKAKGFDWEAVRRRTETATGLREYQVSKLANVVFTKELARGRAGDGVRSYSLHPGVVASDVWRRIPWPFRSIMKLRMISNEEGAKTSVYCAASPEVAEHDGRYYDAEKERSPSKIAEDAALGRELWDRSEEMVGTHLT